MIDRGIEIGRLCGMKMNVEKPKIMNISRQSSPAQTAGNKKKLENIEYTNYLGSIIANNARCTCEIKSRIAMEETSIQQEEKSFHQKIGLKFNEETSKVLYLEHSFVWC
jgi:hypothetical protein